MKTWLTSLLFACSLQAGSKGVSSKQAQITNHTATLLCILEDKMWSSSAQIKPIYQLIAEYVRNINPLAELYIQTISTKIRGKNAVFSNSSMIPKNTLYSTAYHHLRGDLFKKAPLVSKGQLFGYELYDDNRSIACFLAHRKRGWTVSMCGKAQWFSVLFKTFVEDFAIEEPCPIIVIRTPKKDLYKKVYRDINSDQLFGGLAKIALCSYRSGWIPRSNTCQYTVYILPHYYYSFDPQKLLGTYTIYNNKTGYSEGTFQYPLSHNPHKKWKPTEVLDLRSTRQAPDHLRCTMQQYMHDITPEGCNCVLFVLPVCHQVCPYVVPAKKTDAF
jgi:hypothetical protein